MVAKIRILGCSGTTKTRTERCLSLLKPRPKITVSQWAEEYRYLSRKDSARPGRWKSEPHQREIMDAFSDPKVRKVVVMAASQVVGKSQMMGNVIGYYIHTDPSNIMVVHPKIDAAEKWSKGRFDPLVEATPVLRELVPSRKARDKDNTILHRMFRGGQMFIVGANAPADLAAQSVRILLADEVDRYEVSAGAGDRSEGDPLTLAEQRTETYGDFAKVGHFSTPLKAGLSRINTSYLASDRRTWEICCQHCDHFFAPTWLNVQWDKTQDGKHLPETARMVCPDCGTAWTEGERRRAIDKGRWRPQAEFAGVAGFHINALGCKKIKDELPGLVRRWISVQDDPNMLKTFINLVLAEPFSDPGSETPDWEMVWRRQQPYELGVVPKQGLVLTAGVDVQGDRIEVGVYAWGRRLQNYLVAYEVFRGDPAQPEVWRELDNLLAKDWPHADGKTLPIRVACIDSGGRYTNQVYAYVGKRRQPFHGPAGTIARLPRTVAAIRGMDSWKGAIVAVATPEGMQKRRFGALVFSLGVSYLKSEIMGWLKATWPSDAEVRSGVEYPPGAVHISTDVGEEYAKQLCSEILIKERKRGIETQVWRPQNGRRNEALDVFVYARAATFMVGMERFQERHWQDLERAVRPDMAPEQATAPTRETSVPSPPPTATPPRAAQPKPPPAAPERKKRPAGIGVGGRDWLNGRGGSGWLGRR
jgi:phage terminase large subunit GpA-like protein